TAVHPRSGSRSADEQPSGVTGAPALSLAAGIRIMTSNPRYGSAAELIRLTLELASSHVGKSIDEIASSFGIKRRTAERRLAALRALYPALEYVDGDDRIRRWRLPIQGIRPFLEVSKEELAALAAAEKVLRRDRIRA